VRNFQHGIEVARTLGTQFPAADVNGVGVAGLFDQFGHVGQLPVMMREFNASVFITARGIPNALRWMLWRGTDGTAVLVANVLAWYCNSFVIEQAIGDLPVGTSLLGINDTLPQRLEGAFRESIGKQLAADPSHGHLLLLIGCDHSQIDRRLARVVRLLQHRFRGEYDVRLSRLEDFAGASVPALLAHHNVSRIEDLPLQWANGRQQSEAARVYGALSMPLAAVNARLNTLRSVDGAYAPIANASGELRSGVSTLLDVTSSVMLQKRDNARCLTLLERFAEPAQALLSYMYPPFYCEMRMCFVVVLMSVCARVDDSQALWLAWKAAMQNHAHDSIGGCRLECVCVWTTCVT
jgi:hypothetical protein